MPTPAWLTVKTGKSPFSSETAPATKAKLIAASRTNARSRATSLYDPAREPRRGLASGIVRMTSP